MKPSNFPARKMLRKASAGQRPQPTTAEIDTARAIRTKKQMATATPERRAYRRGKI